MIKGNLLSAATNSSCLNAAEKVMVKPRRSALMTIKLSRSFCITSTGMSGGTIYAQRSKNFKSIISTGQNRLEKGQTWLEKGIQIGWAQAGHRSNYRHPKKGVIFVKLI
jgi:hypothetical protein